MGWKMDLDGIKDGWEVTVGSGHLVGPSQGLSAIY